MNENFGASSEWKNEIDLIERAGLLRSMPIIDGPPGPELVVNGKRALNFSSNNYLGLANDRQILKAIIRSAIVNGNGSTASRLIAGNSKPHRELEEYIAIWKGTEKSVVFGSGYQANVGIITALTNERDLIVSDELNHASIIDGCRLSEATVRIYPHLDVEVAKKRLQQGSFRRRILITESIFSMDGDVAPLKDLNDLCQNFGAYMMVDEAHSTGIKGQQGQGLCSEVGICPEIQMGTLGKALGLAGAYVAGSESLIQLIINKARSLIYTTAQPPAIMSGAIEAIKIVASEKGSRLRSELNSNIDLFHRLTEPIVRRSKMSHIIPIQIGDSLKAMDISRKCLDKGVFIQGIRYPSVPERSARLRLTLMSTHSHENLEKAANVLMSEMDKANIHITNNT
ncbi:MAG: 8-amino-7-oxononanoate synthase [Syntrophaceae bacterium]|nr:8-amino-7-oxononanoate synthase [Syntrophaceae bacterium]